MLLFSYCVFLLHFFAIKTNELKIDKNIEEKLFFLHTFFDV
jgi:hypothetical protein